MAASSTRKRESKQNQREILEKIKQHTKEVIQNRKKINYIIDIQTNLEHDDSPIVLASIKALDKVFSHLATTGLLSREAPPLETDAERQVREWSGERYAEFQERLFSLLNTHHVSLQEQSLVTLMHLILVEYQHPLTKPKNGKECAFPLPFLEKLLVRMLDLDTNAVVVLTRFQEFMEYDDILPRLLCVLGTILKAKDKDVGENVLKNLISLLEHITLHEKIPAAQDKPKLFCSDGQHFRWSYGRAKKYFNLVWQQLMKHPLTPGLYKRVLVLLPEKVMPHLEKPLLLTDFLMESYNIGGAVSVLALHGVFLLMQKHNLEYPDFYTKLYALLEPGMVFVKYRARFFYLLDLFLSSTHVPEYIAAAFAKRLSRLALIAPPNVIVLLLHFVGNLLIRHKGLVRLTHNPENQIDVTNDPYLVEEANLKACNATASSLWEIKTLQSHVLPEVAYAAKFIDREMPKVEWDLSQSLELTMDDMLEKELKRKNSEDVPLNFERPNKFACLKHDRLSEFFDLV